MMRHRKKSFNMVEVTLALGVAVIGVVCIMALIPVALNASRDATAENYLPDVAQEILTTLKLESMTNGNLALPADIPDQTGKSAMYTAAFTQSPEFDVDFDRSSMPANCSVFLGTGTGASGGLILHRDGTGLFLILQQLEIDGAYVTEFSGVARVWYEPITDVKFFGMNLNLTIYPNLAKALMVEVSWPANIPWERRKELGNIRTYRMDLFNPEAQL